MLKGFVFCFLGSALIKVGQCEQKLGQIERDFIGIAANCYIQPLRKFLEGEMKTVSKEMAILENKRYVFYFPRLNSGIYLSVNEIYLQTGSRRV